MKRIFLLLFVGTCHLSFGQYKVDSAVRTEYKQVMQKIQDDFIKAQQNKMLEKGFGLLTEMHTDTLNQHDRPPSDTSMQIFSRDEKTGEWVLNSGDGESENDISKTSPAYLGCFCTFSGDTLKITTGISVFSGFAFITSLWKDKATAVYLAQAYKDTLFQVTLSGRRTDEITVPATIDSMTLDRKPSKGIKEIYGKMSVTTAPYYNYSNAWNFKHGYVHERMRFQIYFRCKP